MGWWGSYALNTLAGPQPGVPLALLQGTQGIYAHGQDAIIQGCPRATERIFVQCDTFSIDEDMMYFIFAKSGHFVWSITWVLLGAPPRLYHHCVGIKKGFLTVYYTPQTVHLHPPSPPDPLPINPLIYPFRGIGSARNFRSIYQTYITVSLKDMTCHSYLHLPGHSKQFCACTLDISSISQLPDHQ